jgi:hypothetical protein
MRVYFEGEADAHAFLRLCKLVAYVTEENEKFRKLK